MAVIGSITIGLSAQTDKLEKGLLRAEKSLLKFGATGKKDVAEGLLKLKVGAVGVAANLAAVAAGAAKAAAASKAIRTVGEGFALMGAKAAALGKPLGAMARPFRAFGGAVKESFGEVGRLAAPLTKKLGDSLHALRFNAVTRGLATLAPGFRVAGAGAAQLSVGLLKLASIPAVKTLGTLGRTLNALPTFLGAAAKGAAAVGVAAAVGFGGLAMSMAHAIDQTGDAADRLGTTTAALSELRYAAQLTGSEGEVLDGALQKLNANLGDAATKGGPAADALKRLGLDAQAVARMDPTEAFRAISGGFAAIPTDAEKAALAMDLFGKQGTALLNTLNAGPAALDKLADDYRKFGGSVSEVGRQQIGAMFDSLDRTKAVIGGIGSQLAVQLSPFVQAAAEEFIGLATSGGNMGDVVGTALKYVAKGVGFVADIAQGLKIGFIGLQAVGAEWGLGLVKVVEKVGGGLEKLLNLLPGVHVEFSAGLAAVREEMEAQAEKAGAALNKALGEESWSKKVEAGFERIKARAAEAARAVAKSGGDAKKGAADFGISKEDQDKAKKALEKLKADADQLFEQTRTPLEKYQAELKKIGDLKAKGLINEDTAARATKAAGKDLGGGEAKFAGALTLGSAEARSAILKASSGRADGTKTIEKNTATANDYLQQIKGAVETVASAVRGGLHEMGLI